MADATVQLAPDGTGKLVDNSSLTVGSNTVYRQRVNFADPTDPLGLARVMASTPSTSDYGVVVRHAGPLPQGTNYLGFVDLNVDGYQVDARPDGQIRTQIDPTTLLYDTFDALDTTNTWTSYSSGGSSFSFSNSILTLSTGTTAGGYTGIVSKPTFLPGTWAFLQFTANIAYGAAIVTNAARFWGLATITTPTGAVPVQNGAIFEVDSAAGTLRASVYVNGSRTLSTVLGNAYSDGAYHRYAIYYKASRVYFEIDGANVGNFPFPSVAVGPLSVVIMTANGASAPSANTSILVASTGLGDSARLATKIADGQYPWRQATVKAASAPALATDGALVVAAHPSSPMPLAAGGVALDSRQDGVLRVAQDPSTVMYDSFDTLDTNLWQAGGSPTVSTSILTVSSGTTASATTNLQPKVTLLPPAGGWLVYQANIQIEAAALTNVGRAWGLTNGSYNSAVLPMNNGVAFELDYVSGGLSASVFSNNVRTQTTPLTRPTDGLYHRYAIYYRASRVYFEIDGVTVAQFANPNVAVGPLGAGIVHYNHTTAPSTGAVSRSSAMALAETGKMVTRLADGTYPHRTVTVKESGFNAQSTDRAVVVALHPLSPVSLTNATATAKGTQSSNAIPTQDLKDSGRTRVSIIHQATTATATTDTLMSLTKVSGSTQGTAATSIAVTSGKRLRINAIFISLKAGAAAVATATVSLRIQAAAAATISSQVEMRFDLATAATAGAADRIMLDIPDGFELAGSEQLGISIASSATTNVLSVGLHGFEY